MSDDFMSNIAKVLAARILETESQIQETVPWSVGTKGWLPLAQAVAGAVGLAMSLTGVFLLGWQASWILGLGLGLGDAFLVTVLGLVLVFVLMALVQALTRSYRIGVLAVLAGVVALLVVLGILANVASVRFDVWHALALVFGVSLLVPGLALSYRQLVDLVDPFGKTSPMERALIPYLSQLFGTSQPAGAERGRLILVKAGDKRSAVTTKDYQLHDDDLDFIAFVSNAVDRGLSRRSLVTRPRLRLRPTGTQVTRDVYDRMMEKAEEWEFVDRGGDGVPASWLVDPPEKALEVLMDAVRQQKAA